jgi:hypothetical protein
VSEPPDPDEEVVARLRSVLGCVDPVPPAVTDFARAALGWRRLDADLAELLADSALETEATALTRSAPAQTRWLTFRGTEVTIDVEVTKNQDAYVLLGQLAPNSGTSAVEVQAADGAAAGTAETDALGRFRLDLADGGRMRLRLIRLDPSGSAVETSWFTL